MESDRKCAVRMEEWSWKKKKKTKKERRRRRRRERGGNGKRFVKMRMRMKMKMKHRITPEPLRAVNENMDNVCRTLKTEGRAVKM